jgi:hypothetical protein
MPRRVTSVKKIRIDRGQYAVTKFSAAEVLKMVRRTFAALLNERFLIVAPALADAPYQM